MFARCTLFGSKEDALPSGSLLRLWFFIGVQYPS